MSLALPKLTLPKQFQDIIANQLPYSVAGISFLSSMSNLLCGLHDGVNTVASTPDETPNSSVVNREALEVSGYDFGTKDSELLPLEWQRSARAVWAGLHGYQQFLNQLSKLIPFLHDHINSLKNHITRIATDRSGNDKSLVDKITSTKKLHGPENKELNRPSDGEGERFLFAVEPIKESLGITPLSDEQFTKNLEFE